MYSSTIHKLPCIDSYARADVFFNKTALPPRSKKWSDYQRPLRGVRYYHYRIEKGADVYGEFYDLVLYSTALGRFYKPVIVDGKTHQRRMFRGHHSQTSRQFLHYVLGMGYTNELTTTDGEQRIVPVYAKPHVDSGFSLDITLVDNRLDLSRSQHTPHYSQVANDEDKQHRAAIRERLKPYIMLAVMRMPEYEANVELSDNAGRPFGSSHKPANAPQALRRMAAGMETQQDIDEFFKLGQSVFNTLASKRAYEQKDFLLAHPWWRRESDPYDNLVNKPTPAQFEKSLMDNAARLAGANRRHGLKEIPQFPRKEDYPHTNIHV